MYLIKKSVSNRISDVTNGLIFFATCCVFILTAWKLDFLTVKILSVRKYNRDFLELTDLEHRRNELLLSTSYEKIASEKC